MGADAEHRLEDFTATNQYQSQSAVQRGPSKCKWEVAGGWKFFLTW